MDEKKLLVSIKLDEQKIASRLKEIRTELDSLEKSNENLKKSIKSIGDDTGIFSKSIEANNRAIQGLQKEYEKLESKLNNTSKKTKDFNTVSSESTTTTTRLNKTIDESSDSFDNFSKSIEDNEERIKRLSDSEVNFSSKVNNAKSSTEDFSRELKESSTHIDDFRRNLDSIESKEIDVKLNIDSSSKVEDLIDTSELGDGIDEFANRIKNAEINAHELGTTLSVVSTDTNALKTNMVGLGIETGDSIEAFNRKIRETKDILEDVSDYTSNSKDIGINISSNFDKTKDSINEVKESLESLSNELDDTKNKFNSLGNTEFDKLKSKIDSIISVSNSLSDSFSKLGMEGGASVSKLVEQFSSLATSIASEDYIGAITKGFSMAASTIQKSLERISGNTEKFKGDVSSLNSVFQDKSQGFFARSKDSIENFLDSFVGSAKDAADRYEDTVGKVVKNVGNYVEASVMDVASAYQWLWDVIFKGYDEAKKNYNENIAQNDKDFLNNVQKQIEAERLRAQEKAELDFKKKAKEDAIDTFNEISKQESILYQERLKNDENFWQLRKDLSHAEGKKALQIELEIVEEQQKYVEKVYKTAQKKLETFKDSYIKATWGTKGRTGVSNEEFSQYKLPPEIAAQFQKLSSEEAEAALNLKKITDSYQELVNKSEQYVQVSYKRVDLEKETKKLEEEELDRNTEINKIKSQDSVDEQRIFELRKQGIEARIKLLEEEKSILESERNFLTNDDEISANTEDIRKLSLQIKSLKADYDSLDEAEKKYNNELERNNTIQEAQKNYNEARRTFEEGELDRKSQISQLKREEADNEAKILSIQRDSLKEKKLLTEQELELERTKVKDSNNLTEQEIDSIHKLEMELKNYDLEIEELTESIKKYNETLDYNSVLLSAQREVNDARRKYEDEELTRTIEINKLREDSADNELEILRLQKEGINEKIALIQQEIDLEKFKVNDSNNLTEQEIDSIHKLELELRSQQAELAKIVKATEDYNNSLDRNNRILNAQKEVNAARRKFESEEIDRQAAINKLRKESSDSETRVLQISRESYEEKIALLEQEIELQQLKTRDLSNMSEEEVESLHRLQMELKRTKMEMENLSEGTAKLASETKENLLNNFRTSSDALSALGLNGASAVKRISDGIKKLGAVFKSGPLLIITAILAAISIAYKGISSAIEENEELTERLQNAYKSFEPIINAVKQLFYGLAEAVIWVVEQFGKFIRFLAGTEEEYQNEINNQKALKKSIEELGEAKRKYADDESIRAQKITELDETVKDKELKTINERIAAQKEINKLKIESLKQAKNIADRELEIFNQQHKDLTKLTEEEKDRLNELTIAAREAANAINNAFKDDSLSSILSDTSSKEIKELWENDADIKKLDAYKEAYDLLLAYQKKGIEAYKASTILRAYGIQLAEDEMSSYDKLISRTEEVIDDAQKTADNLNKVYERSYKSAVEKEKSNTTTTKSTTTDDLKKQEEEYSKFWKKVLDESEKGLQSVKKELESAQKELEQYSMNPLELFDDNLNRTLTAITDKEVDIKNKIKEYDDKITSNTGTPEDVENWSKTKQNLLESYTNYENLRTEILKKAANERTKLEEEILLDSLEKQLTTINQKYNKKYLDMMMSNAIDFPGGGGVDYFFSGVGDIDNSKLNLEQAKEELAALEETFKNLDPLSDNYAEFADKIVEANLKIIESEKAVINSVMEAAGSYMSAVGNMAGSLQSLYSAEKKEVENSKKTAGEKKALIEQIEEKERGMAVAQIAFNTASSIASVVANAAQAGWPAMIPILIAGIATVIAAIAQAKSAMAGYATGGIVGGNSYEGDKIPVRVNSGEMILTTEQQKRLFNIANGVGGKGNNQAVLFKAFETALSKMPAPILDYREFTAFTSNVNDFNNLVKIR